MDKLLIVNSLGKESIEFLGFKTTDELEKVLYLLTKEVEEDQARLSYKR